MSGNVADLLRGMTGEIAGSLMKAYDQGAIAVLNVAHPELEKMALIYADAAARMPDGAERDITNGKALGWHEAAVALRAFVAKHEAKNGAA